MMLKSCFKLVTGIALAATVMVGGTALAQDRTGWPSSIKIGTASQGGVYFVYGAGWGNLVQEFLGVNATAEVTGGPTQNMALVHAGDLEFGMTTMGPGYDTWTGDSEIAPGVKMQNVRAMFPMYQTPFQIIALQRSGISKVADLNGKRVGVGPRGGTAGAYWPRYFADLGLRVNVSYGGASDQVGQVQDGLIDAFAFAAGVPIPAFSQLEAQHPANIFSVTEEEMVKLLDKYPSISRFDLPATAYRSLENETPTIAMWNFAIASKDMPESFVYEIMKVVLDNNDRMLQIHRSSVETLPENMVNNGFMWFHPGAIRYYREKGFDVPDHLIPPESKS